MVDNEARPAIVKKDELKFDDYDLDDNYMNMKQLIKDQDRSIAAKYPKMIRESEEFNEQQLLAEPEQSLHDLDALNHLNMLNIIPSNNAAYNDIN